MENNDLVNLENVILPLDAVKEKDNELINTILQESDVDKLKDLTHVFNAFQTKRQILRVNALNDVQDALVQQMARRLQEMPNNFNNADIASWMKTVQQALDSSHSSIKEIDDVPTIVNQNNTQVNINVEDTLNKESREKVMNALQAILGNIKNENTDNVYIDDNISKEINNNILGGFENNGNKEDNNI